LDAVAADDQVAEPGHAGGVAVVAPGLAAAFPKRSVRIAIVERERETILADDALDRGAGIPAPDLVAHAQAELIRIRRLEIVVDQVHLTPQTSRDERAQVGQAAKVFRVPFHASGAKRTHARGVV